MPTKTPQAARHEGRHHGAALQPGAGRRKPQTNPEAGAALRPHERRLLRWLAHGHDAAAIAQRIHRDAEAVAARAAELLARLGVDSAQAALDKLGLTREPDASEDEEPADGASAADSGEAIDKPLA